jgi:hypothetical protein
MEIKVFKTYEITDDLWEKIAEGFRESFLVETTAKQLKNSFCIRNQLGYGYHAVALTEDGDVAGYNVFSPTFYKNGIKVVVSGSTYVRPKYRRTNELLFMDMIKVLRKEAAEEGYHIDIGVPNNNSRHFSLRVLKTRYIGDLDYFILPYKVSKCINKPSLNFIDTIISVMLRLHLFLQSIWTLLFNAKEKEVKYEMLTEPEDLTARFKGPYNHIEHNGIDAYYRVQYEDGKKVVYIMDFREKGIRTARSLNHSVRTIIKKEQPDAVLFVGLLRLRQCSLFKVPQSKVPKPLPIVYYVLDKENKDCYSDMDDINNWNFSLMNFDVR